MTPSLFNLLLRGGMSYVDISDVLGIKKHRVQKFVFELERRGWIVVIRGLACSSGGANSNAINEYRRGKL